MLIFNHKRQSDDPIIEEHLEESTVDRDEETQAMYDRLLHEYASPESAIEAYRKGYITDAHLRIRFSPDEIAFIQEMKEKRDAEDKEDIAPGYL